jgi:hypothetical protein
VDVVGNEAVFYGHNLMWACMYVLMLTKEELDAAYQAIGLCDEYGEFLG